MAKNKKSSPQKPNAAVVKIVKKTKTQLSENRIQANDNYVEEVKSAPITSTKDARNYLIKKYELTKSRANALAKRALK